MVKKVFSFFARIFSFRKFTVHKTIDLNGIISEKEIFDDLDHVK
jgi:hypothetical protein